MDRFRKIRLSLMLVALMVSASIVGVNRVGVQAVSAAAPAPTPVPAAAPSGPKPREVVPGQYIVVLKRGVNAAHVAQVNGITVKRTFTRALNSFVATLTPAQVTALQTHPDVDHIEQDQVVRVSDTQPVSGGLWGLDRIDQRLLPLSGSYTYLQAGEGVTAYIIDTGLQANHPDFGGRAQNVFDALGGNGSDCNGHGTHVAGTVGGTTYGVAKRVNLRGVRVLDCNGSGTTSSVIAGIDWVAANAARPAVANMSLGGGFSSAVNVATANLASSGVFVAVAAGNESQNACNVSPASEPSAYTTAASNSNDQRASFSNYGACVDGYAPGVGITSAWPGGGSATLSGTSMASPHVAGTAAIYKSRFGDAASSTVTNWINSNTTAFVIQNNPSDTPNRLLYIHPRTPIYRITAVHSSKCMEVLGGQGSFSDGATVQQFSCLGTPESTNQYWDLLPVGNAYQIVAYHSGKCLDVRDSSYNDGAAIQQFTCLGPQQTNQLWRLVPVGSAYQIVAVHSGKCLDVTGVSYDDWTPLQQYTCLGPQQTNQLWNLQPR